MVKINLILIASLISNLFLSQTIDVSGLKVANGDLYDSGEAFYFSKKPGGKFTYNEVQVITASMRKWRLPTVDEMIILANNRETLNLNGDEGYLCYGMTKGFKLPDDIPNRHLFENLKDYYFIVNVKTINNGYPLFIQVSMEPAAQYSGQVRFVSKNSKPNYNKSSNSNTQNSPKDSQSNNNKNNSNSYGRITTYSASYGIFGANVDNFDLQFQLECSAPFNKERLSSGMKWRYMIGNYSGLNVEGFGRFYLSKESKMVTSNNRWYLQGKLGYGLLKPQSDSYTLGFTEREKLKFTPVAGLGFGYKFLIKEKVVVDFLLGYHYQTTPKFLANDVDYTNYQQTKWKENIAFPIEFQWGIG
jgi:hypothetical protein